MSDKMQERLLTVLAIGISAAISRPLVSRYVRVPERRGLWDDAVEAMLKGGARIAAIMVASVLVRLIVRGRR